MSFHTSREYGPFISLELDQGRIWPGIWWQYEPVHKADTQLQLNGHSLSKHIPLSIYCFILPVDSGRRIQKATLRRSKAGNTFIVITINLKLMTVMGKF